MKIQSPCRNICALDVAGQRCTGCGRTLDEIARWSRMSANARRAIMARLRDGGQTG